MIPIGERHFRRAVTEFVAHYHHERNHQGLGNTLIDRGAEKTAGRAFAGVRASAGSLITTNGPREGLS